MAVVQIAFTSRYLHVNTNVAVILPDTEPNTTPRQFYEQDRKYRVLWLLPGLGCNHSQWLRQTCVERYACSQKTAVVMPSAQNSDYLDWNSFSTGMEACSFFFEELMPMVWSWLPISVDRSKNAIAGPTDAPIRLALQHPERFEAAFKLEGQLTDYESLLADWEPLRLLDEGQTAACRRWREAAEPELLWRLNLVDNFGGKTSFLDSDCNVVRTLAKLAREEHSELPRLHFFAAEQKTAFLEWIQWLTERGIPADFCKLPMREDRWEQLDCAIETVLKQSGKGENTWL